MKLITAPPKSMQIAGHIRGQIAAGKIKSGQRLDSIRSLADRFSVGRQVVHSAFEILAKEGVVSTEIGRGTFVLAGGDGKARRLRIGFYIHKSSLESGFTSHVFDSCCRQGNAMGHDVLLATGRDDTDLTGWISKLDGVLVTGMVDDNLVRRLEASGTPFLVIGNYSLTTRPNNVNADAEGFVRRMVDSASGHFGIKSFGSVLGPESLHITRSIREMLRECHKRLGWRWDSKFVQTDEEEDGYAAMGRMFQLRERPDAVFVTMRSYFGAARFYYEHCMDDSSKPLLVTTTYSLEQLVFQSLPDMVCVITEDGDIAIESLRMLLRIIDERPDAPLVKTISGAMTVRFKS